MFRYVKFWRAAAGSIADKEIGTNNGKGKAVGNKQINSSISNKLMSQGLRFPENE